MRRTRLEIKQKILELTRTKMKPTHLMLKGNLSWNLLREVCGELERAGLLEDVPATEDELKQNPRTTYFYRATPQGTAHARLLARVLNHNF